MKIAIVRGGFDGVAKQMRVWRLEQEVDDAARILLARAAQTNAARSRLRNLQNDLLKAGPSKEVKP